LHGATARIDEEISVAQQDLVTQYVDASELDADGIAALHADSWRRHYRGAYSDSYLDGDVVADRQEVWRRRLAQPKTGHLTVVVRHGDEVLGFAHTILDEDPLWGSLLENLHIRSDLKRTGIGSRLLSEIAHRLLRRQPGGPLHLWVLDQNTAAQAFYDARGGRRVETQVRGPFPGGGRAIGHRYHWDDPTRLLMGPESRNRGLLRLPPNA
jgi:ribosomal protein S18 acetylase RimI-like enzyme